jgi:beta-N-acetylhexosaminidase
LLRQAWGYDGLVFTDDLEMQAIADHFSQAAAVAALRAGADVLLVCSNLELAEGNVAQLAQALDSGVLSEARVGEAVERVRRLKERFLTALEPAPVEQVRERLAASGAAQAVAEIERRIGGR